MAGRRTRSLSPGDGELQQPADGRLLRRSACSSSARICGTASRARFSRSALDHRAGRRASAGREGRWPCSSPAASSSSRCGPISPGGPVMKLDAQDPGRPDRREVGPAQVRDEAGQPGQQAQVHDHRRRHRPGRRVGGGLARRARLQRPELLHPGQPAARAQHRRAGRHQRREELPERRRQRLPAVLRHGQGRRLPLARSERLPARAAERQHHRPVRGAGRAVRARVRRPARQPIVRRRAGVAHVLRARPDRPAAAARRLSVADAAGAREARCGCSRGARCSTSSSSTARRAASSSATW